MMKREKRKNRQRKSVKDIYHVEVGEQENESSISVSDFVESAASDKEGEKLTCTIRFSDLRADGREFEDEDFQIARPQSISLTRAMKPSQSPKARKSVSAN